MSTDITVTVTRPNGTQIAANVLMQLDNLSNQEAAYYGGAAPYFRYSGYTLFANVPFQFQDLLTDQVNVDPKTNTNKKYRVINDPELFPDGHWELVADRVVGT